MFRRSSPVAFWSEEAPRLGFKLIDKNLDESQNWDEALRIGREVMEHTIAQTGMRVGPDTSIVEIGCGIGRLVFALADQAKEVVGADVSPWYIEQARKKNPYDNVRFELIDGSRLNLQTIENCDVVFSHCVFVLLEVEGIRSYARDAFRMLRPGGQFIFELESMPTTILSPAARIVRRALHTVGVKEWRSWPTDPRFKRRIHDFEELVRLLLSVGFLFERVAEESGHTWFVARKPAVGEAGRPPQLSASDHPAAAAH
jgi:ubiquinone/menaquinone biosynthesis C-methylase UbiE